ncbi:alpha/beta hydrolase [Streptomyces sp. NBC_01426]|uniref:alpha/beta hydrolase n=1 Tax=Streptomyces sp. NBC_01426 TaxID=2975866 RepID=UPI002E31D1AC|nr:alpha/beta hydrolase [Streptomyces sp. NBC_01426]
MNNDDEVARPGPVLERQVRAFVRCHACPTERDGLDIAASRARMSDLWDGGDAPHEPDVVEEWLAVPGPAGRRIRVRILRPADSDGPLPVVLYLHGVGWMLTDAHAHRQLVTDLVLGADAAVVIPEYDDPGDARHPGAVEQAHTVARWIAGQGGECGLDGTRMAVIGVSAGAHHAAALTLLANRSGGPRFLQQVLVCPATDAAMDTPSYEEFAEGYFLGRAAMRDYWERYAPDAETRAQRAVSPLRASSEQLRGLPAALVLTAEADVLRDEGEAYAARLREADVPVVSVRYHGTIHGFVLFDLLRGTHAARAARIQITDTLHIALHQPGR